MSKIIMTHSVEETLRIQTAKLNQQLNKLLEQNTRILELEAERDELAAELAEETETADNWRRLALQFDGHRMQAMSMLKMVASGQFDIEEVERFVAAAPVSGNEHLRQIQADAGRAGFIAGYSSFALYDTPFHANKKADQYAERIRKGGTE